MSHTKLIRKERYGYIKELQVEIDFHEYKNEDVEKMINFLKSGWENNNWSWMDELADIIKNKEE